MGGKLHLAEHRTLIHSEGNLTKHANPLILSLVVYVRTALFSLSKEELMSLAKSALIALIVLTGVAFASTSCELYDLNVFFNTTTIEKQPFELSKPTLTQEDFAPTRLSPAHTTSDWSLKTPDSEFR